MDPGLIPSDGPVADSSDIFNLLFDTHYRALVSYAARLTGSYDVGEDIVTDSFVRLYDRPERWNPDETARRFLYKVTYNASIDFLRGQEVRYRALNMLAQDNAVSIEADRHAARAAEGTVEYDELLEALEIAISNLPEKRRSVITLRMEQGLKNLEIADIMGISVKTVELHLSLAMRDLRAALTSFKE